MMSLKASLRVVLMANDVVIAESNDERLWRRTLEAISVGNPDAVSAVTVSEAASRNSDSGEVTPSDSLQRFAAEIGVSRAEVEGASGPVAEPPYLHLNPRYWEALKENTPQRGPGSVAAPVLSATLLALWFRVAGLGPVRMQHVHDVLATLGLEDKNAPRAIRNCSWLVVRGQDVVLNPAEVSSAIALVRAFYTRSPVDR